MKEKIIKHVNNIEKYLIVALFSILLGMMIFGILSRYGFGISVAWTEQMTRLIFVWLSFAGISYAAVLRQHLKVEALAVFAKEKAGKIILLVGDTIATVFVLYLAYRVSTLTINVYHKGQAFSAMPWMPVWVMYLGGLLGLLGMGIRTLQFSVIPSIRSLIKGN